MNKDATHAYREGSAHANKHANTRSGTDSASVCVCGRWCLLIKDLLIGHNCSEAMRRVSWRVASHPSSLFSLGISPSLPTCPAQLASAPDEAAAAAHPLPDRRSMRNAPGHVGQDQLALQDVF